MTHDSFYFILLLPINLDWRWLLLQPLVLKVPKQADMENKMYHLQGSAVGKIQSVCTWSHLLQHPEVFYILVLELPWKLQPEVPSAQKNLLAHAILHISTVPVSLVLFKPSKRAAGACEPGPESSVSLRPPKCQQYCPRPRQVYPEVS